MSARKPDGFVDEFFNNEKLSEIWDDGLKIYRAVEGKYDASGNNGSKPRCDTHPYNYNPDPLMFGTQGIILCHLAPKLSIRMQMSPTVLVQ